MARPCDQAGPPEPAALGEQEGPHREARNSDSAYTAPRKIVGGEDREIDDRP